MGLDSPTRVRKAVIPVAGLGTRFLPASKSIPKEMIPIVDVPVIQYIVEEAVQAGIQDIILVTSRQKGAIEDHFDYNYELEERLEKKIKPDLAQISRGLGQLCNFISIRQKSPQGLGHAILCAQSIIGEEPFAILLADELMDCPRSCTAQLLQVYEQQAASVIAIHEVPASRVNRYGIVQGTPQSPRLMEIEHLEEKPAQSNSRWAISGRYLLGPAIFMALRSTPPGKNGEIQLTDGLQRLVQSERLLGLAFEGQCYDTGDQLGFINATLAYALKRPDLRAGVRALMREHLGAEDP